MKSISELCPVVKKNKSLISNYTAARLLSYFTIIITKQLTSSITKQSNFGLISGFYRWST